MLGPRRRIVVLMSIFAVMWCALWAIYLGKYFTNSTSSALLGQWSFERDGHTVWIDFTDDGLMIVKSSDESTEREEYEWRAVDNRLVIWPTWSELGLGQRLRSVFDRMRRAMRVKLAHDDGREEFCFSQLNPDQVQISWEKDPSSDGPNFFVMTRDE